MKKKKINYVKECILKEYLNHLGDDQMKKVYYTGYMVNKLIKSYLGIIPFDDRDSYINKSFETPGFLLGNLTYQCIHKITKDIKNFITKEVNSGLWNLNNQPNDIINDINIHKLIKSSYIENILKGAMATGNWGMKVNASKQGVSQVLNRLTYPSTISHLEEFKHHQIIQENLFHQENYTELWGYVCPTETPEGQAVGIVKNLSLNSEVTVYSSSQPVRNYVKEYIISLSDFNNYKMIKLISVRCLLMEIGLDLLKIQYLS